MHRFGILFRHDDGSRPRIEDRFLCRNAAHTRIPRLHPQQRHRPVRFVDDGRKSHGARVASRVGAAERDFAGRLGRRVAGQPHAKRGGRRQAGVHHVDEQGFVFHDGQRLEAEALWDWKEVGRERRVLGKERHPLPPHLPFTQTLLLTITPSQLVARKSADVSSTMPKGCLGTETGGAPRVSVSVAADPVTDPVPYTRRKGSGRSLYVEDALGLKREWDVHAGERQSAPETHVSDDPVSKQAVKFWGGVPRENSPKYCVECGVVVCRQACAWACFLGASAKTHHRGVRPLAVPPSSSPPQPRNHAPQP